MGANRDEPTFGKFAQSPEYGQCKEILEGKGWMNFLWKFQGFNGNVALAFAQSFDGENVKVSNLKFKVIEESISRATGLPSTGEPFFKGGQRNVSGCAKFLKPTYQTLSWSKGVLHSCLDEKWHLMVTILQRFITCEGSYGDCWQVNGKLNIW